jgi:mono/diheme cytochrome c family protein
MLTLLLACYMPVHPTDLHQSWAAQQWPDVSLQELEQGRDIYLKTCGECHGLIHPERYSPEEWPDWIVTMQTDQGVEISAENVQHLQRYLESAAAMATTPTTAARPD